MSDIVERLRDLAAYKHDDLSIGAEAADVVESLRQQLADTTKALNAAKVVIASTDKVREFEAIKYRQADEAIATLASEREANALLTQQLAECQARLDEMQDFAIWLSGHDFFGESEYFKKNRHLLAMPSDSTALDSLLAAAELKGKREALLDARQIFLQTYLYTGCQDNWYVLELSRMAKELE